MMEFRIADTFSDSLAKLTGEEQKAAKTTAFDPQLNAAATSNCTLAILDRMGRALAAARDQPIQKLAISRSTN